MKKKKKYCFFLNYENDHSFHVEYPPQSRSSKSMCYSLDRFVLFNCYLKGTTYLEWEPNYGGKIKIYPVSRRS